MTLPTSGPLTFSDIQTEFGGTNPIALNEYYAGGGLVPAGTSGTYGAVPSSGALSVQNFYGTSALIPIYIEEVFSTYLYTGTGSAQTITNGIDFSTNGGLLWLKARNDTRNNWLYDTNRGYQYGLRSDLDFAETTTSDALTAFNNNGFSIGTSSNINASGNTLVSWSFRQQPKFFDVVTYTGAGTANPSNISHNLGSTPGFIMVKQYSASGNNWICYHTSLGNTQGIILNGTGAAITSSNLWNNTSPTSTQFTVGTSAAVNGSGSYVAYLFAHNAGGFGATGTDNVISCGTFDANNGEVINLGYEPQWLLYKDSSSTSNWRIADTMRGLTNLPGTNAYTIQQLVPNSTAVEGSNSGPVLTSTGFTWNQSGGGNKHIYIAIRRGPMKVPTSGTSVFAPVAYSGNNSSIRQLTSGFPIDVIIGGDRSSPPTSVFDRLRGVSSASPVSATASTADEQSSVYGILGMTYLQTGDGTVRYQNSAGTDYIDYFFRRAPSYLDEICYTGTGVSGLVLNHNLTVVPEFIIVKERTNDGIANWSACYNFTPTTYVRDILNRNDSVPAVDTYGSGGNNYAAAPTATTITVGTSLTNANGSTYVAYLFATCAGVSKVGTFTGTGALQTVNCGFSSGARWVMIKRSDSTGDWYVWDSARGISSGNDPYLLLNSTAAEVTGTNYVDTTSVGFQVTAAASGTVNVSGGTYIFLAIA